jgi:RNA polymerase-associated protein CTR9
MRQTEEQRKQEEIRKQREEEMLQKRQEYVEKTKSALVFGEMPSEKSSKKFGKKGKTEEYISDSGGSGNEVAGPAGEETSREKKQRRRKASSDIKEKKPRGKGKRKRDADDSGGKPLNV